MTEALLERPLPHDPEAERAVLGAILIGNKVQDAAFDLLEPEDFFADSHRRIFRRLMKMRAESKAIDQLTLYEELVEAGELDAVGGAGYVASLLDGVPRVSNVATYSRIVKGKSRLRRLIHISNHIIQQASAAGAPVEEILDRAAEAMSQLVQEAVSAKDEGVSYRDAAVRLLQGFDEQSGVRIFSDIDELDKCIGGFRAGELILHTADTGVGKTLLAQQTRRRACRDGRHTLFASAERRAEHLVARELATEARVEHWKMRRPERISPEEMQALIQAASHKCDRCRILDGEISLSRIRSVARQMKARTGLDLVIIDYDELVDAPGETELDQQRNLVRGAKGIAVELGCTVILISQLRKALQGEDRKKPTLQRLYGSGAKTKHPHIVIYVDREYVRELKGAETAARIVVLKNRDGRVGAFDAYFNVRTLRFESLPGKKPDEMTKVGGVRRGPCAPKSLPAGTRQVEDDNRTAKGEADLQE